MTNEVVVEKLKQLKAEWAVLKDDTKPKIDRRDSAKKIIELSEEIQKVDKTFEPIDLTRTKYEEFVPITFKRSSNVDWGEEIEPSNSLIDAVLLVKACESQAVQMTMNRLPKEPVDSQKFGMIVSAYTDKILRAYIHQNS